MLSGLQSFGEVAAPFGVQVQLVWDEHSPQLALILERRVMVTGFERSAVALASCTRASRETETELWQAEFEEIMTSNSVANLAIRADSTNKRIRREK